jgi:hypothetical protein
MNKMHGKSVFVNLVGHLWVMMTITGRGNISERHQKGDCILVAQGAAINKRIFIAGIVASDAINCDPK